MRNYNEVRRSVDNARFSQERLYILQAFSCLFKLIVFNHPAMYGLGESTAYLHSTPNHTSV